MKDLLLWARLVVRTSNMKILRHRLADYVKNCSKKHAGARLFFFIEPMFVALSLPSSFLKLPNEGEVNEQGGGGAFRDAFLKQS